MTKIYTKTGDEGETSLLGNKRVKKCCLEIDGIGEIDELNAMLGVLVSELKNSEFQNVIKKIAQIQRNLFVIGSNVAALEAELDKVPKLKEQAVLDLENWIDKMEKDLKPLHNFILPGGSRAAAQCFLARAVCRRAERVFISVKKDHPRIGQYIGQYLNRLSDALFVLARWLNKEDVVWKK